MSSSRSVAAARARRAPETSSQSTLKPQMAQQRQPMQQQQQQQMPSYAQQVAANKDSQMKQSQPQQTSAENKLSVSDAFALVTLRLGRVELLLQKWQAMGVESESGVHIPAAAASSAPDVNNTIVKSLVSRIDDLERSVKAAVSMKDFDAKIEMLIGRNTYLHNELRDAKDTIFKLQTITLETSQKMMSLMMAKSAPEVVVAPSIQDDVDEGLDLGQTIEGEEGDVGDENLVLEVEGQTA
jgi:hypothetical protein